jgi:hypothetical protein
MEPMPGVSTFALSGTNLFASTFGQTVVDRSLTTFGEMNEVFCVFGAKNDE